MKAKGLEFSAVAKTEIKEMRENIASMFDLSEKAFKDVDTEALPALTEFENKVDEQKRSLIANHFVRLTEGKCKVELSPYYSSTVAGLERVADHLVNVGYSIVNPTGSQKIGD